MAAFKPAAHTETLVDSMVKIVWQQRRLVIRVTAVCLVLAVAYLLVATPYYTVSARLLLQRNAPKFMRDGNSDQPLADNSNFLFTQQQVATSTPVLALALANPGVHDIKPLKGRSDALAILRKQVSVDVGKKDDLLTVSFDSTDPADGTLLVNAIVDAYSKFQIGLRRNTSSQMEAVLHEEREAREKELEAKTQELITFQAEHGLSKDPEKANVNQIRLQGLSEALMQARLETVSAQSAYTSIARALKDDPARAQKVDDFLKGAGSVLPSSSDDSMIRQEMISLKAREIELRQRFMPNHPSVIAVQKRIDELDIAFAAGVKHRFDAAVEHEADLQRSFDQQQQIAYEVAAQQAEMVRRQAQVAGLQKLIDTLDTRSKEVALTEDGGVPSVTVLEPARASDKPTHPDRLRTLLLAAVAGVLVGSTLALAKDLGNQRTGDTFDVELDFGMPVLGHLPLMSPEISPYAEELPLMVDLSGGIGEIVQGVRQGLSESPVEGRATTILVTSPGRNDGKSVLAANLAISLASQRRRVLLLDADFRSPSIARTFGLNSATGLGTLLESDDPLPVTAIHHTGSAFLDVIVSGQTQRPASDLLNDQKFSDLLGDLAHRYEYIVLDAPPAMNDGDARVVAASCDATVLVVREGRVNRQAFNQSREGLSNVGAHVVGVVLNTGSDVAANPVTLGDAAGRLARGFRPVSSISAGDTDPCQPPHAA